MYCTIPYYLILSMVSWKYWESSQLQIYWIDHGEEAAAGHGYVGDTESGGGGREGQVGVSEEGQGEGGAGVASRYLGQYGYLTPPRAGDNFSLFDR